MAVNVTPGFYNRDLHYAFVRTAQVTVGTTATRLLEQNDGRLGCVVTNADSVTIYIGREYDVANGNGHALLTGNSISLVSSTELFASVASGTAIATVIEEMVR
jgi:S-adenosylmethionine:tRNA-ribosyltransferase-isomerase (queuine synthetase)